MPPLPMSSDDPIHQQIGGFLNYTLTFPVRLVAPDLFAKAASKEQVDAFQSQYEAFEEGLQNQGKSLKVEMDR